MTTRMTELLNVLDEKINIFNNDVANNDAAAMAISKDAVSDALKECSKQAAVEFYNDRSKLEHPMYEILKDRNIDTWQLTIDSDTGLMRRIPAVKKADIKAAMHFLFPRKWTGQAPYVSKAKHLVANITGDTGKDLGVDMRDLVYVISKKEAVNVASPTSNKSRLKALQQLIDEITFIDNGNGENTIRANNHDLKFILNCMTGKGKDDLSVKTKSDSYLLQLVAQVIYRIANDFAYSVDNKALVPKSKVLEAQKAKNAEKKAEDTKAKEAEPIVAEQEVA